MDMDFTIGNAGWKGIWLCIRSSTSSVRGFEVVFFVHACNTVLNTGGGQQDSDSCFPKNGFEFEVLAVVASTAVYGGSSGDGFHKALTTVARFGEEFPSPFAVRRYRLDSPGFPRAGFMTQGQVLRLVWVPQRTRGYFARIVIR